MTDEMEELESLRASNHAFSMQVEAQQKLLDALTTPNVSYFDMTPAEEIAQLESKVKRLEAEGRFSGTWADYHEHMTRKVQVMEEQEHSFWEALTTYGQHTVECTSHTSRDGRWLHCNCGWETHPFNPINKPRG